MRSQDSAKNVPELLVAAEAAQVGLAVARCAQVEHQLLRLREVSLAHLAVVAVEAAARPPERLVAVVVAVSADASPNVRSVRNSNSRMRQQLVASRFPGGTTRRFGSVRVRP